MPSHSRSDKEYKANNDYYTPAWIFESLRTKFDLDVCAPIGGTGLVPAARHYSLVDDGLVSPWEGVVWMNPPFSAPTPWIDKFIEHSNGICLVAMSRSKAFIRLWNQADALVALPNNLLFVLPDGKKKGIFMPCILAAMGDENVRALHNLEERVR